MLCYIYGLIDPRTNELRYIGQTHRNPERRLAQHCRSAKNGTIYAKDGDLSHPQHDNVEFSGWTKFIRNTAVKSVSVQGVD